MRKFFNCEKGASAIEYGLLVALIGVFSITGFQYVGKGVSDQFTKVGSCLEDAGSTACK